MDRSFVHGHVVLHAWSGLDQQQTRALPARWQNLYRGNSDSVGGKIHVWSCRSMPFRSWFFIDIFCFSFAVLGLLMLLWVSNEALHFIDIFCFSSAVLGLLMVIDLAAIFKLEVRRSFYIGNDLGLDEWTPPYTLPVSFAA